MTIGVDLRALQVGHQFRGIGEVTKQCLNRIFELALEDKDSPNFVFYEYDDSIDPKKFLAIPKDLYYEEVVLGKRPSPEISRTTQEKRKAKWNLWFGSPLSGGNKCDVFLQFDYALGLPKNTKTILIAHDIIPLIFWNDYFESAWVPFKNRAARTTLRTLMHNCESKWVLRRTHKNADKILCVSESTKEDLHKYLNLPYKKMSVAELGVSVKPTSTGSKPAGGKSLPTKPFLLFVGGIDKRRRRIDDLIAAYNNLKAGGHDIQLALVGENFRSPEDIPIAEVRKAILDSSYADDILTFGYVDDVTKQQLFKSATAFVFPTMYEGFGIPILEAMLMSCPVITYKNSSIPEVGGKHVLYAEDWHDIWRRAEALLGMPEKDKQIMIAEAKKHAEKFTWDKTAKTIYDNLAETAL